MTKRTLHVALEDRPSLQPLRDGRVTSDLVDLEFADIPSITRSFRDTVERQPYDVAEIAVGAFLQARHRDRPLALLPVVVAGEMPHTGLRIPSGSPIVEDLDTELRRALIGVRSYSQTTGIWVRGMLRHQFGVDLAALHWLTFEASHVDGFVDPANTTRAVPGEDLLSLLHRGGLAAAVIGPEAADTVPLIADVAAAERDWITQFGGAAANHVVTLRSDVAADADVTAEVYRMLGEAHALTLGPVESRMLRPGIPSPIVEGRNRVLPKLELAIQFAVEQAVIPSAPRLADLFVPSGSAEVFA